jgi:hypothetical protein
LTYLSEGNVAKAAKFPSGHLGNLATGFGILAADRQMISWFACSAVCRAAHDVQQNEPHKAGRAKIFERMAWRYLVPVLCDYPAV